MKEALCSFDSSFAVSRSFRTFCRITSSGTSLSPMFCRKSDLLTGLNEGLGGLCLPSFGFLSFGWDSRLFMNCLFLRRSSSSNFFCFSINFFLCDCFPVRRSRSFFKNSALEVARRVLGFLLSFARLPEFAFTTLGCRRLARALLKSSYDPTLAVALWSEPFR